MFARADMFRRIGDPTDTSFVDFDSFPGAAHWLDTNNSHGLANAVAHEPSGFESDAKHPQLIA